ncbi:unnamed protein product [Dracunculus medinensis]|uniref:28S ribosomal protein S18-2, mitochondrial n=1 Tax=Dracunculus medinensis TaxID=318479 RepID=A0A0N4UC77_DRAME|nr:unnamed protein product [Dracunculus medinensis]
MVSVGLLWLSCHPKKSRNMAWSNLCRRTIGLPLFPLIYNFSPVSHFHFCSRLLCEMIAEEEKIQEVKGFAFNHVEKKKGLFKPNHTIEEQINYMQSKVYEDAYKGLPVYMWYRRNVKGQLVLQPPPRIICLDKEGKFRTNNPCPICRDEYLFFDFRNPALIEMFLYQGTETPLPLLKTGLCREQYMLLQVELLKAKEHGVEFFFCTIKFCVPFRNYDYCAWYPWWTKEEHKDVSRGNLEGQGVYDIYPDPLIEFPAHKREYNTNWDKWWLRYDKFVQKGK